MLHPAPPPGAGKVLILPSCVKFPVLSLVMASCYGRDGMWAPLGARDPVVALAPGEEGQERNALQGLLELS